MFFQKKREVTWKIQQFSQKNLTRVTRHDLSLHAFFTVFQKILERNLVCSIFESSSFVVFAYSVSQLFYESRNT